MAEINNRVEIDCRNLFYEKLRTGINLFTGSGFSVLKDSKGKSVPSVSELVKDLCLTFDVNKSYEGDLEKLCFFLKRNYKSEFQKYLRERYTVKEYNKLYEVLYKIKLSSIITTNIDNIIPAIMDNSYEYYLNIVSYIGPVKKDSESILYIPLHGNVLDSESELYFGKFELCNVNNYNRGLFSMMHGELLKKPTVFLGYGFHDGSVLEVIDQVLAKGNQDIWIQVMPNSKDIDFIRDMGCNIIIGDTESILNDINDEIFENPNKVKSCGFSSNQFWNSYKIPTINQVESMPVQDFYEQGKTHWYHVLTDNAYITSFVNEIIDLSINNKNIIIVGIPFGGKTTLLMQVACKINKAVYYISDLNDAKAKMICNIAKKEDEIIILLIDNCAEDMLAYRRLAECKNICTIATSDDYMYESSKHLLEKVIYKKLDIPDIEKNEAHRIFEHIPSNIRADKFEYKQHESEKYSILELISSNVKNIISKEKIYNSLVKIKSQNYDAFELILLTAYLIYNKSALTTDILVGYYGVNDIIENRKKIKLVQTYLSEMDINIEGDEFDQDYYSLRSALFADYTHHVACDQFKKEYGNIIKKFIHEVPPCYIYKYYVFKREAYDASLFKKIFGDCADDVYKDVYENNPSAYALQQWALYKAHMGRFSEAFSDIDKAINLQPYNFSVKNARAIILFEANKDKNTDDAQEKLNEAMHILETCYLSDKRKIYHVQKYAQFALEYYKKYDDDIYIEPAFNWLKDLIEKKESMSKKTKELYSKIRSVYSNNN